MDIIASRRVNKIFIRTSIPARTADGRDSPHRHVCSNKIYGRIYILVGMLDVGVWLCGWVAPIDCRTFVHIAWLGRYKNKIYLLCLVRVPRVEKAHQFGVSTASSSFNSIFLAFLFISAIQVTLFRFNPFAFVNLLSHLVWCVCVCVCCYCWTYLAYHRGVSSLSVSILLNQNFFCENVRLSLPPNVKRCCCVIPASHFTLYRTVQTMRGRRASRERHTATVLKFELF